MSTKFAPRGPRSDDPPHHQSTAYNTSVNLSFLPLIASGLALASVIFIGVALGTHEWIEGTALRDGRPIAAYVGLGKVRIGGETRSLGRLCPRGTNHTVPDEFADTPPGLYCQARRAGTWGAWLIWLAYLPLWAACILSAAEGLANVVPQAQSIKDAVAGLGFDQQEQSYLLVGCWAASWGLLFIGLLAYASFAPDTLGWGTIKFEASFGLVRLTFLIVTMCTAVMAAKQLRLWHEENFVEALSDFMDARGVRKILYLILFAQLVRSHPPVTRSCAPPAEPRAPCPRAPSPHLPARAGALPPHIHQRPVLASPHPALRPLLPRHGEDELPYPLPHRALHDAPLRCHPPLRAAPVPHDGGQARVRGVHLHCHLPQQGARHAARARAAPV